MTVVALNHSSDPAVEEVVAQVLRRVQSGIAETLSQRTETRLLTEDRVWINDLVTREVERYHAQAPRAGLPILPPQAYALVRRRIVARVTPLGPLAELLADPLVEEVIVNGPKEVLVVRDGELLASGVEFAGEDDLLEIVRQLLGDGSSHLDRASPMVTATLPDGSRMNAVLSPIALPMAVTIRRHQLSRFTKLFDLAEIGALPWELVPLLQAAVRARLNLVVSGSTGSGKTTLLRVLIREVPASERIITIEDQRELHLRTAAGGRANCISLEAREANTEGRGEITIQQLVRNALRQRPDRIFVGESRGPEALDVIDAMGTGHDGSGTTLHANSIRDALSRLSGLVRRNPAQTRADPGAIARELASKVDLVIHLARFTGVDGRDRRVVHAVGLVTGQVEGETPTVEEICRYHRGQGRWQWALGRLDDLPLKIRDKFESAGIEVGQLGGPADSSLGELG